MILRPYQEAIMGKLRAGFAAGHQAQILYLPTGGGKTEIAISLMEATAKKYNRAAMVLDRIVLCDQTSKRLDKWEIDHGVLQSGHWRYRPHERIQVCSAQTLEKRGSFPGLNLLIIDECHAQRQQTLEFIKSHPGVKVVGLTATPFTDGLCKTYTNVVCSATTEQLTDDGFLVPLKVYIAKEIDMSGAKKVAGEWSQGDAGERGIKITGDVVAEWVKKTTEIFGGPRKTIVFCANVAHGADLAEKFAAAGYNFVPISYRDSDEYKREAVEDFAKPDTAIHGLIACDILTKGFDVPDVMVGISARPFSKSLSSHIQQMGRIMRPATGKEFGLWLDHSGNYLRFREDWDAIYRDGVHELQDSREKAKKERSEREKEQAKCPACGHLWPSGSDTCPACGHVRQSRNYLQAMPGELVEIDGSVSRNDRDTRQRWYSELLCLARDRGYQSGWVAHKYREKFGQWPRNLSQVHAEPSMEVIRWEKSRRIAWAKRRQAA